MSTDYASTAATVIANAEFRQMWPVQVRKDLVRAAQTTGEFPPYAVQRTERALRTARAIERRMERQIAQGEQGLSQAQRRALAVR